MSKATPQYPRKDISGNIESLTVHFPVVLFAYTVLLVMVLCMPVIDHEYGFTSIEVALFTSFLLYFTHQKILTHSSVLRFKWWYIIPALVILTWVIFKVALMTMPDRFSIDGTDAMKGSYILTFLLTLMTLAGFVLRLKTIIISEWNPTSHYFSLLIAVMIVLFIISGTKMVEFYAYSIDHALSVRTSIIVILIILLSTSIYQLSQYLIETRILNGAKEQVLSPGIPENSISQADFTRNRIETLEMILNLERVLDKQEMYLNSAISLELLAEKSQIPKHKLSQLLNVYYKKSFYQLIAEYRIGYAMKIMQKEDNISLDALSHLCGFNSKSTFYKYFKEINGCTPNEYIRYLNLQKTPSECQVPDFS